MAEANDPLKPQREAFDQQQACSLCGGKGHYMYDDNHGKPCEQCCKHTDGWWELTEHHAGFIAGADNGCCRAGCGQLRRELHQANAEMADANPKKDKA